MLKDWKNIIFRGWGFIRILRLLLASFIIVESIRNYDIMFGVIGSILLLQAVLNVGCCSNGACYASNSQAEENETKEIIFEEVKSK